MNQWCHSISSEIEKRMVRPRVSEVEKRMGRHRILASR